jgi:hypothetical protein
MPIGELACVVSERSRRLVVGHAADLAAAQAVVDEREELAGHGDAGFVLASSAAMRRKSRCSQVPPW